MKSFNSIVLIFASAVSAQAADTTTKFSSLADCQTYYTNSVSPVIGQTVDSYCADKVVAADPCMTAKIAEYVQANNLKTFTNLTNTEQVNLKNKFSYQCQVAAQTTAAAAAQKVAAAQAASAAASGGSGSSSGGSGISTSQAIKLAEQGGKILGSNKTVSEAIGGVKDKVKSFLGFGGDSKASDAAATATAASGSAGTAATESMARPNDNFKNIGSFEKESYKDGSLNQAESKQAVAEGQTAAEGTKAASAEVAKGNPELKGPAEGVEKAATNPNPAEGAAATQISAEAEAADAALQKMNEAITPAIAQLDVSTPAAPFTHSIVVLQKSQTEVNAYIAQKKACTAAAEKATFLCVEGTSPGVKAAKGLMDAAGPIISVISSAQKTCSSTSNITNLAGLGLTAAKGVCVAAKLFCDQACGKSTVDINKMDKSLETELTAAIQKDISAANAYCAGIVEPASCYADIKAKETTVSTVFPQIKTVLSKEATVAPGTAPKVAATCGALAKDVALLAVQSAGAFMAQKNAKSCSDKLASSGAAGATVSTQQYCDMAENVNSELCVCKANPMATGCAGAIVASSNSEGQVGFNIKSASGQSAFAGGFGGNTKPSATGSVNLGDLKNNSAAGLGSGSAGAESTIAATGGAAGSSGSSLGNLPAAVDTAATKEDKKKWNFNSFGGLGGGGSGSASGAGYKAKSGATLGVKDTAAIQRQIAAEKFSAEVSKASGKSNWEKVRNMYMIKEGSFILGQ